jgi:hypothetical protein
VKLKLEKNMMYRIYPFNPGRIGLLIVLAIASGAFGSERYVKESARDIPVIKQVDVLVIGGSSAGVAAAATAADAGVEVFLAAERPYLGQDLCRTYQMWVSEAPQTELAKRVFGPLEASAGTEAEYDYTLSIKSSPKHAETEPPTRLNDGKYARADLESVEFQSDVAIDVDLKAVQSVQSVQLFAFQRQGDFVVEQFELEGSLDGRQWTPRAVVMNEESAGFEDQVELVVSESFEARYLRVKVRKKKPSRRILLGELKVFVEGGSGGSSGQSILLRPFELKYALERILHENRVDFMFGCYPTEVFKDGQGNLKGVVFSNRSGRQAVIANTVVDASQSAVVARLAGAQFEPFSPGKKEFGWITVGGAGAPGSLARKALEPNVEKKHEARRYRLTGVLPEDSYAALQAVQQKVMDQVWSKGQVEASGRLIYSPNRRVIECPENLVVLGAFGGLDDPVARFEKAERLGAELARRKSGPAVKPDELSVSNGMTAGRETSGEIREFLGGPRSFKQAFPTVHSAGLKVPVLGDYDVVVVGGGTSGASAAIAASRQGAKTLVIEYLDGLGGVGTSGMIGRYCLGVRKGFTEEIDRGLAELGGYDYKVDNEGLGTPWDIELKKEWYRQELRKSGCEIWFGAAGCGTLVEGNRVRGVAVATPYGRGVVRAGVVIDATGSADVAVVAGAEPMYIDADNIEIQGTGLSPRRLGAGYINSDYDFVNDNDMVDVWRMHLTAKYMFQNIPEHPFKRFKDSYDIAQLIDTRERRRIKGRMVISPVDIFNERSYPDTVSRAYSNFDTHGYTTHPMFMVVWPPHGKRVYADVPYRCMLPKGIEGVIVTGIGISAHRDALPVLRMQPDVQNNGYAAGLAAAQACRKQILPSGIDVREVQQEMIRIGALPADCVLEDNFPVPDSRLAEAVNRLDADYHGAEILLCAPERSIPLLRKAYERKGAPELRLVYAHLLAMFGEDCGVEQLVGHVNAAPWDAGWNWIKGGQFDSTISRLDSRIIALGLVGHGNADVVKAIIRKAEQLDPDGDFSHFLAISMACNELRDPRLAPALHDLLSRDEVSGFALTDTQDVYAYADRTAGMKSIRNQTLKEILLARALYRCGDHNGLGRRILETYSADLRGIYAKCTSEVLAE